MNPCLSGSGQARATPVLVRLMAVPLAMFALGCAGPSRETVLDEMVGQDVEIAVESFGKPAEVVNLEGGRYVYVWRREFRSDVSSRSSAWPERRIEGWDPDPDRPVRYRACLTNLYVGFDFIIERWERECRYETEDRR